VWCKCDAYNPQCDAYITFRGITNTIVAECQLDLLSLLELPPATTSSQRVAVGEFFLGVALIVEPAVAGELVCEVMRIVGEYGTGGGGCCGRGRMKE
jgi:hypothetical protein